MKSWMTPISLVNFFSLLILLASCATDIDYKIPAHRFVDPETRGTSLFQGEVSGFAQLSYQRNTKLTMSEVYDFGVFGSSVNDEQAFEETSNLGFQTGLGLFSRLDLIYRNNGDSPEMGLVKLQLIGEGLRELKEEFKLAIWAGAGSMDENEGSLTLNDGDQIKTFNGSIEVDPWELGLSLGQRLNPNSLIYLNLVHAKYPSRSTLLSSDDPDIIVKGTAKQQALTLGLKVHQQNISCHLEAGYTHVKWDEDIDVKEEIATLGLAVSSEF